MTFTSTWTPPPKLRDRQPAEPSISKPVRRGTYSARTEVVAVPKGQKCKPGKGAPNKEERAWLDWVSQQPCVACRIEGITSPAVCVHHILSGGRRIGHLFTISLCPAHHQHDSTTGFIARHPYKAQWERCYGLEMEHLHKLQAEYQQAERKTT